MINSRSPNDLHPKVMGLCFDFVRECKREGIDILITSTYRDMESQAELYAIGRTKMGADPSIKKPMGDTVTNAKPGDSFHNYRVAFDWVPIINGKAIWNDKELLKRAGAIAKRVGLEWAGDWKSFPELVHCQYTAGITLAEFKAGKTLDA